MYLVELIYEAVTMEGKSLVISRFYLWGLFYAHMRKEQTGIR